MSEDDDAADGPHQPHRAFRVLAVVFAASVIGASLGTYVVPPTTIGAVLVAIPVIMLAIAGAFGIIKGEPIVAALAGLGLLLVVEALLAVAIVLMVAAFGFLLTALLTVAETYYRNRD